MNVKIGLFFLSLATLLSCSGEKAFDGLEGLTSLSGALVITTVATDPSTGPGMASLFSANGIFQATLKDFYSNGTEFPTGSAFLPPNKVLISVEGMDRIDQIDLDSKAISSFVVHNGLTATPLRQMARSTVDGSVYVVESNTNSIEKFDAHGARAGNPFIGATVGSCSLSAPYSVTFIASTQQIAVISAAASGRLSIYDKDGNCVRHITTSPLNTGTPSSVTFHEPSRKLIITRAGDHSIWSVNLDGTDPTQIYLNSTIINVPRAVTADSSGYIYVSSTGTDTVEKLYYDGVTVANRVLSGPLIGPGIFSQNVTSISVIP